MGLTILPSQGTRPEQALHQALGATTARPLGAPAPLEAADALETTDPPGTAFGSDRPPVTPPAVRPAPALHHPSTVAPPEAEVLDTPLGLQLFDEVLARVYRELPAAEVRDPHQAEQEARAQVAKGDLRGAINAFTSRMNLNLFTAFARGVYRPTVDTFRKVAHKGGELIRAYGTQQDPDSNWHRHNVLADLHANGKFKGAFGNPTHDGLPVVMSPIIGAPDRVAEIAAQQRTIGRDLVLPSGRRIEVQPAVVNAMVHISGMSFPQLSAQSILTLLYTHLKLAKERNTRFLFNTGEGGPDFHLALLHGDREGLKERVAAWAEKTNQAQRNDYEIAKVHAFIDHIMDERDALFAEFGPEDLARAQIVAQFGTAMNGIRGENHGIDLAKLQAVGRQPGVAMIEYKLKQAAKRGGKLDTNKIDHLTAALREIERGGNGTSPDINPELDSYEDIAKLVLTTKLLTGKPVSLKFAVGDVEDLEEFLTYLRDADALPDHIQIGGSGVSFSPGSGNAPPTGTNGDTSLSAREAVIAADAVMKTLGIRDKVFLTLSGDIRLPTEGVLAKQLGADGIAAARTWMAMGLGCAQVRACDGGNCPYGIASKNGNLFAQARSPVEQGPKAFEAAKSWFDAHVQSIAETGANDWRTLRKTHGLHAEKTTMRIKDGAFLVPVQEYFGPERARSILRGALTPEEIDAALYDYRPPEYLEHVAAQSHQAPEPKARPASPSGDDLEAAVFARLGRPASR